MSKRATSGYSDILPYLNAAANGPDGTARIELESYKKAIMMVQRMNQYRMMRREHGDNFWDQWKFSRVDNVVFIQPREAIQVVKITTLDGAPLEVGDASEPPLATKGGRLGL